MTCVYTERVLSDTMYVCVFVCVWANVCEYCVYLGMSLCDPWLHINEFNVVAYFSLLFFLLFSLFFSSITLILIIFLSFQLLPRKEQTKHQQEIKTYICYIKRNFHFHSVRFRFFFANDTFFHAPSICYFQNNHFFSFSFFLSLSLYISLHLSFGFRFSLSCSLARADCHLFNLLYWLSYALGGFRNKFSAAMRAREE